MGLTPILRWEKALGKVGTSERELLGGAGAICGMLLRFPRWDFYPEGV